MQLRVGKKQKACIASIIALVLIIGRVGSKHFSQSRTTAATLS